MFDASAKQATLTLVDYDKLFREDPDAYVVQYTEDSVLVKDQMSKNRQLFFQDGTKDLSNIASCECGHISGNYMEGTTCPYCHTTVKTNFAEDLKFRRWLEIPDFLPPVLHPGIYRILENWLGPKSGILTGLLDTNQKLPAEFQGVFGQGFEYFYKNFDNIINYLAQCKKFNTPANKRKTEDTLAVIAKYRDRLFVRHIPALNSSLHLSTQSGTIMYSDDVVKYIIEAKLELCHLVYVYYNGTYNKNYINERMCVIYNAFLEYTSAILNKKLLKKPGFIRKQLLGARLNCSARAVIVPIFDIHNFDEVYIPWCMAVEVLKLEIINVLMNRKHMTGPQAESLHRKATAQFVPEVYEIIETLIEECPYKGLPLLMGRNPSLRIGAIFLLYATKVKTDYEDATVSITALASAAPNYDFDGDAMHLLFLKEMDEVQRWMHIHPTNVLLASDSVLISSDIQITDQAALALDAWLLDKNQNNPCEGYAI